MMATIEKLKQVLDGTARLTEGERPEMIDLIQSAAPASDTAMPAIWWAFKSPDAKPLVIDRPMVEKFLLRFA